MLYGVKDTIHFSDILTQSLAEERILRISWISALRKPDERYSPWV